MRAFILRLLVATILATASWLTWSEAKLAARRADATEHIVTLRHAEIDPELDARTTATAAYWLGRYGEVRADSDDRAIDADVLLTAANAEFREAQREIPGSGFRPFDKLRAAPSGVEGRDPGSVMKRLDGVLNAYASALKSAPRNSDAAYNYEFVARLRDQIARTQGKGFKPPAVAGAAMTGDLPSGPTIHGRPGAPPPEAKMEELQMLAPMEYGDREAQPEATPGAKRERKG